MLSFWLSSLLSLSPSISHNLLDPPYGLGLNAYVMNLYFSLARCLWNTCTSIHLTDWSCSFENIFVGINGGVVYEPSGKSFIGYSIYCGCRYPHYTQYILYLYLCSWCEVRATTSSNYSNNVSDMAILCTYSCGPYCVLVSTHLSMQDTVTSVVRNVSRVTIIMYERRARNS